MNTAPKTAPALLLYIIDTESSQQFAINVPPAATVARAKAAFLRAATFLRQQNNAITFTFHGVSF
jgi:hypothetical protein